MNVAIYLRVSKADGSQDATNQEPDCRRLCEARGWLEPTVVTELESAVKERPVWRDVLELAHRGIYNVIVVWSLDRVGRSMWRTIDDVRALERAGCRLVSVRESWLDTGGPAAPLLLAIFSWVADHERQRLIERTKAGLERARRQGTKLGRKPVEISALMLEHALRIRHPKGFVMPLPWRIVAKRLRKEGWPLVHEKTLANAASGKKTVPGYVPRTPTRTLGQAPFRPTGK
jgi:putative DNA-invertase from lambdoid prophage Rac